MSKRYNAQKHWYAVHTYSGYEEKVAESVTQRAESLDMKDKIFQVMVPKEKMIEIKNGKRKVVEKKIFQGYVFVEMKLTEDADPCQVGRLDHALYLGREFVRAETALISGEEYIQD